MYNYNLPCLLESIVLCFQLYTDYQSRRGQPRYTPCISLCDGAYRVNKAVAHEYRICL